MSQILNDFFTKSELLPENEFAALMNWSPETLKAKKARREVPDFIKVKNLVVFRYADVTDWIDQNSKTISSEAKAAAAADLLGLSKHK